MKRLQVRVEKDHLASLTHTSPITGIGELVWNALDADASNVRVMVIENELGGVESVEVIDDGHGMTYAEAVEVFERLGGSWKLGRKHSRNDARLLHGEHGQGRWRAFAIGAHIEWHTVADDSGRRTLTRITGGDADLREFVVDDPIDTDEPIGTRVVITLVDQKKAPLLLRDDAVDWLIKQFALYLEQYRDLAIIFRGGRIDPSSLQTNRTSYELEIDVIEEPVTLEVIEWEKDLGGASSSSAARTASRSGR